MVISIRQNQDNIVALSVETSVANPYFLITFRNPYTTASFNALFQVTNDECSYYTINIEEVGPNGTVDYVNGKIKLSPSGSWDIKVYSQASSTNLDPSLADEILGSFDLLVESPDVCVAYPPTPSPPTICDQIEECNTIQDILNTISILDTDGYGDKFLNDQGVYVTVSGGSNITLTTTGNSGAATLISDTLNIPEYTLSGLGGQAQLNGTGFVKINGTNISYDNSTYLTGNQTITLSGDVSGSGSTSISVTIGNGVVTNAKLANSSITINGTSISLGASATITANTTNALTVDNSSLQLDSGTTFNGSSARTISVKASGITNAMLAGSISYSAKMDSSTTPTFGADIIFSSAKGIKDANGNYVITLPSTVASAVNYFTVSNSASTSALSIAATGSDTNISINLASKGTGSVVFNNGLAGTPSITFANSPSTGFYSISSNSIGVATGGAAKVIFGSSTMSWASAYNVVLNTTTGSTIATTPSQKLGFWGATAVVQPSGWGTPTGTLTRTTFDTTTVTLQELAERVAAMIVDDKTTGLKGA